jgi:hypothetical protein
LCLDWMPASRIDRRTLCEMDLQIDHEGAHLGKVTKWSAEPLIRQAQTMPGNQGYRGIRRLHMETVKECCFPRKYKLARCEERR